MRPLLFNIIPLVFILGCNPDLPPSPVVGPCEHQFLEPILQISGVTNDGENLQVDTVYISEVKYNGNELHPLLITSGSENITLDDELIICSLPCGFGTQDGQYTFTAFTEELTETHFSFTASYARGGGSCPSFSTDGTVVWLDF